MTSSIRVQRLTLIGSILIMLTKAIAFLITSSNAILSDVLESGVNVAAGAFALFSLILASKPRDEDHPYGHGKIEFLSATFEGALILVTGGLIIVEAVYHFIYPHEIQRLDIGIYLTAGAGLVNFIMGIALVRIGKKEGSMTMEADGKHLLTDAWSTVGMIIGLTIIFFTKLVFIDNVIALIFGLLISVTGINILKKSIPGIMDEADRNLLEDIIQTLEKNRADNWIDLHNLRVIKYGSVLHIDCHITLPWYFNNRESHREMKIIEEMIQENYGKQAEMFIHTDPCNERSCSLCCIENCKVREHPFVRRLEWDASIVLSDVQHSLQPTDEKQQSM